MLLKHTWNESSEIKKKIKNLFYKKSYNAEYSRKK